MGASWWASAKERSSNNDALSVRIQVGSRQAVRGIVVAVVAAASVSRFVQQRIPRCLQVTSTTGGDPGVAHNGLRFAASESSGGYGSKLRVNSFLLHYLPSKI